MSVRKVAHIQELFFKIPLGFEGSEDEIIKLISKQLLKNVKIKAPFDFDMFMKNEDLTMARSFEILEPQNVIQYKPAKESK